MYLRTYPYLFNFRTVLSLKMGTLMGDQAMIQVNIIGFGINVVFMVIFYLYASGQFKSKIWLKMGVTAILIMSCLTYCNIEDPAKIEFRLGMLITAILVILVGMPLLSLGEIIDKKSTEGLPFPLILSGTIVAASWAAYGIAIRNEIVTVSRKTLFAYTFICMYIEMHVCTKYFLILFFVFQYQNMFLLFLSLIQLSLFIIFPSAPTSATKNMLSTTAKQSELKSNKAESKKIK